MSTQPDRPGGTRRTRTEAAVGGALVAVALVALAFNLRPAAVSVGPVLTELTDGLRVGPTYAGVLTSLPVVAFAVFGSLAPTAARRLGPHRVTILALAAVVGGLVGRSWSEQPAAFLALSLLALAGMATANVVLPSLVRLHFPDRIGLMTAAYSTSLAVGLTLASVLTVPLADAVSGSVDEGWRPALALWALPAAAALLLWSALGGRDRRARRPAAPPPVRLWAVARTRLGLAMALLFGCQSLQAYAIFGWAAEIYRDAGFSPATAGLLLGVITGVSIPLSILVPTLTARLRDPRPMIAVLTGCYVVGYGGLILAPAGGAWAWAVIIGIGQSTFPLVLTLIGLRARTAEGTAALSGFTQSAGYLLAIAGPLGMGLLHDATGSWTVPLVGLLIVLVPQTIAGWWAAAPHTIEDELAGVR